MIELATLMELIEKRKAIAAHLATVEDFICEETQLLEILKELALALALDELAELDELNELADDELAEEEGDDESI